AIAVDGGACGGDLRGHFYVRAVMGRTFCPRLHIVQFRSYSKAGPTARASRDPPDRLRDCRADRFGRAAGRRMQCHGAGRAGGPGDTHGVQGAQAARPGRPGRRLPWREWWLPAGPRRRRHRPAGDRHRDRGSARHDRMQCPRRELRHPGPVRRARQLAPDQRRGARRPARRHPRPHAAPPTAAAVVATHRLAPRAGRLTMPVTQTQTQPENADIHARLGRKYDAGFVTDIESDSLPPGLDEDRIRALSAIKGEPEWMTDWRLEAYRHWLTMPVPHWAKLKIAPIDFQAISYYSAPKGPKYKSLDEVPQELLDTYDKLGVPLHERAKLAGVAVDAVFDSVSVGTTFRKELADKGIIFCSMSEA